MALEDRSTAGSSARGARPRLRDPSSGIVGWPLAAKLSTSAQCRFVRIASRPQSPFEIGPETICRGPRCAGTRRTSWQPSARPASSLHDRVDRGQFGPACRWPWLRSRAGSPHFDRSPESDRFAPPNRDQQRLERTRLPHDRGQRPAMAGGAHRSTRAANAAGSIVQPPVRMTRNARLRQRRRATLEFR